MSAVTLPRCTLADLCVLVIWHDADRGCNDGKLGWGVEESWLCVRLWELDPRRFGMHGHRNQHPDTKTVASLLSTMCAKTRAACYRPRPGAKVRRTTRILDPLLERVGDKSRGSVRRVRLTLTGVRRAEWLGKRWKLPDRASA